MPFLKKPVQLQWTVHAKAKMNHYRLTPSRVRHVMHTPKRIEEGIAPNTIAMMQPVSMKTTASRDGGAKKESWSQEIWVMVQDKGEHKDKVRTVISAWRYPGVTKVRDEIFLKKQYNDYNQSII